MNSTLIQVSGAQNLNAVCQMTRLVDCALATLLLVSIVSFFLVTISSRDCYPAPTHNPVTRTGQSKTLLALVTPTKESNIGLIFSILPLPFMFFLSKALTSSSVSYTHLDVYKRQDIWGCFTFWLSTVTIIFNTRTIMFNPRNHLQTIVF